MDEAVLKDSGFLGDETRPRLLRAALKLFALYGFDAVSTRQIAAEAGVNLAGINYHFGGKQGLYDALIRGLVEIAGKTFNTIWNEVDDRLAANGNDPRNLAGIVSFVVDRMVRMSLEVEGFFWTTLIFLRESQLKTEAFEKVFAEIIMPNSSACSRLAGVALGLDADSRECRLTAHQIMMTCFTFAKEKPIVLRRLGWDDYESAEIDMLVGITTRTVARMLGLEPYLERCTAREPESIET